VPRGLVRRAAGDPGDGVIRAVALAGRRYLYTVAPLNGARVVFARDLDRALAIVGPLRRALAVSGLGALLLAMLLGAFLARQISGPVRSLAAAAGRLSRGDFDAPLTASTVGEVERVTVAFREMREALAARIGQLREANRMLEERQARLTALQAELIQRERVATSGRMAAELAHEIRNPVANVRNCLELLHRRLGRDPEGRQYASFAIDELLRMHELAERMLHLNRPRDPTLGACDAGEVAEEVAALARIGAREASISVHAGGPVRAAIVPDALKQILLNLVQNARDAVPEGLRLVIDVRSEGGAALISVEDNGPGIPAAIREHVFDPFFTTRVAAGGVGLGLFVVEGIVRGHGGSVAVEEAAGGGARFRIRLPASEGVAPGAPAPAEGPPVVA
jgi:signal transduction histidine kinase